ncbi:MAG: anhydro-N-acetylmuramic acid kinase [Chitinophagaceae bacterium]
MSYFYKSTKNEGMVYRAIGLMSGSSLDGLDIVFAEFHEQGGKWTFSIEAAACLPYSQDWVNRLSSATSLAARDYCLLHTDYGHYLGAQVNEFIEKNRLHYKVSVIGSHGHTSFHLPAKRMTAQLGDGAAIAAETGLPVVSELRALDVALGGQGAPIVPMGEQYLFPQYDLLLNIGGIANLSMAGTAYLAFDCCPANRVLNILANEKGLPFDNKGKLAASGKLNQELLSSLNAFPYYAQSFPKSLANEMGTDEIIPLLKATGLSAEDLLATYTAHIAFQIKNSITSLLLHQEKKPRKLLVTGGGAFNEHLIATLREQVAVLNVEVVIPEEPVINYKEALIMGFLAVLRWRQESTVLSSVTGASRDSIGGALWNGQEA